jgi:hypothetical protein
VQPYLFLPKNSVVRAGNTNSGGGLSTVYLLLMVACFI